MDKKTLLWIDDSLIFLKVATRAAEASKQLEVAGTASSAKEGLSMARKLQPDVICVDLGLPDCHGLDLITLLKDASPQSQVIAVSLNEEDSYQQAALKAGAEAFIFKPDVHQDLRGLITEIGDKDHPE